MNRYWIDALAALALFLGAFSGACGGDDGETFDVGDGEITISDEVPEDFPDDFPIYNNADVQGSYRGESEGIEGLVVTWTTGDSVDDVASFYEQELEGGAWTIQSQGDQGDLGSFFFALSSDESKAAYVYIAGNDDDTSILVTVGDNEDGTFTGGDDSGDDGSGDDPADSGDDSSGDDAGDDGSGDDGSGNAELPDEQELPDDFPSSVPLPDDIRVTSSSSLASGGTETFFVEFYSEQEAEALADFFETELAGAGWTESFRTESDGTIALSYATADPASTESVLVTIDEADVDGYRLVSLVVSG